MTPSIHGVTTLPDGSVLPHQPSGNPDAPSLLLLQGQANAHTWWDGLRGGFDEQFRVVTFDYRGTGGSCPGGQTWPVRPGRHPAVTVC